MSQKWLRTKVRLGGYRGGRRRGSRRIAQFTRGIDEVVVSRILDLKFKDNWGEMLDRAILNSEGNSNPIGIFSGLPVNY